MADGVACTSEESLTIRARRSDETLADYIKYLSAKAYVVTNPIAKQYLISIIDSYNTYQTFLNGFNQEQVPVMNSNKQSLFEERVQKKLEFLKKIINPHQEDNIEGTQSLEEIKKTQENAPSNTIGRKNKMLDVNVGDLIVTDEGMIIGNNYQMNGDTKVLTGIDSYQTFLIERIIYLEKKESNDWCQVGIDINLDNYQDSNVRDVMNDLNTHCSYNPEQYCKICHIISYGLSENKIEGFIHNCEYKIIGNIDSYEMVKAA